MKNSTLNILAILSPILLASCNQSLQSQSLSKDQSSSTKSSSLHRLSAGTACLSDIPADQYPTSIFSSCSARSEPTAYYDNLAAGNSYCNPYADMMNGLPVDWIIKDHTISSAQCQWSSGNQSYYLEQVDSVTSKTRMTMCSSSRLPFGWVLTGEQDTSSCHGQGLYIKNAGTLGSITAVALTLVSGNEYFESASGAYITLPSTSSVSSSSSATLSSQALPHSCALGTDGPLFRRQTLPALTTAGQAPAYVYMNVTLPALNDIAISRRAVSGWIYLGGRPYSNNIGAIDMGLFFDPANNMFGIGGASVRPDSTQPNGKRRDPETFRYQGNVLRILPGSNVTLEFYIDQQNIPTLKVTTSTPFQIKTPNGGFINLAGPQSGIFPFPNSTANDGYLWNPGPAMGTNGQPLKAMVTLAYNNLTSTQQFATENDKMNNVTINSFWPGVITGFTQADRFPVVRRVNWPTATSRQQDQFCATNYTNVVGGDRAGRVSITMPSAPPAGTGGGGQAQ